MRTSDEKAILGSAFGPPGLFCLERQRQQNLIGLRPTDRCLSSGAKMNGQIREAASRRRNQEGTRATSAE